jgi:DNA-binding GntR family transcriptional regulator
MGAGQVSSDEERTTDRSTTDQAYATLRAAIVDLRVQPGEFLQESALARRLGMSRTPVREALRRLQGEGLVAPAPLKGVRVVEPTVENVDNASLALEVLEGLASRLAAHRRSAEGMTDLEAGCSAMRAAFGAGDLDAWVTADGRPAHGALVDAIVAGDGSRAEAPTRDLFAGARADNVRLLRHRVGALRQRFKRGATGKEGWTGGDAPNGSTWQPLPKRDGCSR